MPFDSQQSDSFTFMTDVDGKFTSVSPAVFYALGYQPSELTGMTFESITDPCSKGSALVTLLELLRGRQPFEGAEIGLARKDGKTVEAMVSGRPIVERGTFHGFQGVALVVGEYRRPGGTPVPKEAEAELLLDLVCHDVNNMNQIVTGYLEIVQKSISPESDAYGYIDRCVAVIDDSASLIRNVQKLRRTGEGARTPEKVDVGRILSEAIGQYASESDIDLSIDVQASKCTVVANELLKDVFLNIIGNAVKYAVGAPVIRVRVGQGTEEGKDFCVVAIDDNGPGIPDEMKRQLFERTGPARAPDSSRGLGLYLVRRLIEGFGGKVWVEDRVPGDYRQGSKFVVSLPVAEACPIDRG